MNWWYLAADVALFVCVAIIVWSLTDSGLHRAKPVKDEVEEDIGPVLRLGRAEDNWGKFAAQEQQQYQASVHPLSDIRQVDETTEQFIRRTGLKPSQVIPSVQAAVPLSLEPASFQPLPRDAKGRFIKWGNRG